MSDERGESGQDPSQDEEIPTAAYAYSDSVNYYPRRIRDDGKELVYRDDHEQRIKELSKWANNNYKKGKQIGRERERQRITELIEEMKQEVKGTRLHSADVIEAFNELLDEVEQE